MQINYRELLGMMVILLFVIQQCATEPQRKIQQPKKKIKRSKEHQPTNGVAARVNYNNNMYDQIAEESESNAYKGNRQFALNLHSPSSSPTVIRSPRADANYLTNFRYTARGDSNGGGSGPSFDQNGGRQMSSFSLNSIIPSGSSAPSEYIYGEGTGSDNDNYVAAGGHHQSYGHGHGHGHGHGWGHQSHGHGHGKDCNSALGLLGVLGLASYLQNVLRQLTTTTVAMTPGRRKRALSPGDEGDDLIQQNNDLTEEMLPLLTQISFARDGQVPWKCALRPVCLINSIISRKLGKMGQPLKEHLATILESSSGADVRTQMTLKRACRAGEGQKDCFLHYPHCPQMEGLRSYNTSALPLIPNL